MPRKRRWSGLVGLTGIEMAVPLPIGFVDT